MPALAVLGLSPIQEDVYLEVVGGPPATHDELVTLLPRYSAEIVRRTLDELRGLGLLTWTAGTRRCVPVSPDVALEALIVRRQRELARARAVSGELLRCHQRSVRDRGPVEAVAGAQALRELVADLQLRAVRQVRMFDAPPYVHDPGEDPAEREMLARGVVYRVIYDHRALALPGRLGQLESLAYRGERPRLAADLPMKLMLVDDAWGLIPLHGRADVEGGMLIRPSALLDALSALFETWWGRTTPVRLLPGTGAEPAPDQRHLLALLAAGVPDERICAVLRLSPRTLHRRVKALMRELQVATRFQLGAEAARRGLL